jgi:SpoVK/Ycf46/Vps4 family AAA+-type ATPase
MATAEQVKALIKSHAEGDDNRFYSVALQMAAQAARQGHSRLADELRKIIDNAKEQGFGATPSIVTHIRQPRGELTGLLSVSYPKEQLATLIMPDDTRMRLQRIVLEQRQKHRLAEHGLSPRKKVLLFGPPGTGKTLTASALAGELHLPLYRILFDGLITKYMGETAAKLRLIFDSINQVHGVYFFDEFDAIGAHRSSANDVGEIRRVLNSFLQFLEQSDSDSLILAATNNLDLLDRALFRRFDDVIEYQIPSIELALQTFRNLLSVVDSREVNLSEVANAGLGLSYAEIAKISEDAIKNVILSDKPIKLTTGLIIRSIRERSASRK